MHMFERKQSYLDAKHFWILTKLFITTSKDRFNFSNNSLDNKIFY